MRVKTLRRTHRWLGFLIGIQLLAWTVSGLYFSWNPIEDVRGEHLMAPAPSLALSDTALASPSTVLAALHTAHPTLQQVDGIHLRRLLGTPVYEIPFRTDAGTRQYALADARTGTLRPPLTEAEAVSLAQADFVPDVPVRSVERVTEAPDGSEYRSVPLPAYRVAFDHPSETRLYVSAARGRIEARRNGTWRWFDWLWMLHIMDYESRDDFNHWLLQAFSIFGVATVLSGFVLGGATSKWLRGRPSSKTRAPTPASGTRRARLPKQERDSDA